MSLLDRYIVRELVLPFLLGLVIFTFLLMIDPLAQYSEQLIAKGVSWGTVARVLGTLVPQALAVTIPISLLMAMLMAFGRFSADRESVAMQACGISIYRLLRPVLLVAAVAWAATSYIMFVAMPTANQTFREIVYGIVSARAENEIKPRVFFEDFPNRVLYVRDGQPAGGWRDVFLADTTHPEQPTVFMAKTGRLVIDRDKRTVDLVLNQGARHTANLREPAKYEIAKFREFIIGLDPNTVFPRIDVLKGDNEMTITELEARATELRRQGLAVHGPLMAKHRKFAIPVACFVFALIGLGLGMTSGREGKLAAFVPGIAVVFGYYIIEYLGQAMAKGQVVPAWLASWTPDLVLGFAGLGLLYWRARSADRPIRLSLPSGWWARRKRSASATLEAPAARPSRTLVVIRIPAFSFRLPNVRLLDLYVGRLFIKVAALAFFGLLGIFYISRFIDLSDKLFKGQTTAAMLLQHLYYATPQFVFYIIPLSVLISAMVTIGILMKNSELVVMRACGLSLYRTAAPILLFAAVASGVMFALQEQVLAYANRRAESLRHVIRGGSPRTFDVVNRKWLVSRNRGIYNYAYFDPRRRELNGLSTYDFRPGFDGLAVRTYVSSARFVPGGTDRWQAGEGWVREFDAASEPRTFATFPAREMRLEAPDYFATESPDADRMTYVQLKRYISDLSASGFNVVSQTVALHRKISFPFVAIIMTLIAVPFAVTTGRRGALYGIAAGIVLAVVYWITINGFTAVGSAGMLPPLLAAWAPNVIFGAAAAYLLLTVRT
jgi:LPS export ABC transporter permease LptG/LPS export ABC transporter permease LptF